MPNRRTCQHCGGHLVLIGSARKNGKPIDNDDGRDWESREYHKKCYKEIQQDRQFLERMRIQRERDERKLARHRAFAEMVASRKANGVRPPLPDPVGGFAPLQPPIV